MKKITFILIALIAGTSFGQDGSASGIATVRAEIVTPIEITDGSDLNFGSIVAAGGGNVRVSTDGTRTFSNNDMNVETATTISAASFYVTAANTYSYNISIPSTVLSDVASVGTDMPISFTQDLEGDTDGTAEGTGSAQELLVGGLLTVAAGQEAGSYEGTVTVTVVYE